MNILRSRVLNESMTCRLPRTVTKIRNEEAKLSDLRVLRALRGELIRELVDEEI